MSEIIKDNIADKVYTPDFIVEEVLAVFSKFIEKDETILEPFRGGKAFYDKLKILSQKPVEWCEIDEGRDFFEYEGFADWIITNPPYSIFDKVLLKSLKTADNIVLVVPTNKILSSMPRLTDIKREGFGIKQIHYLGSGRQLKFPFGFPVAAVWIQKGWCGSILDTYEPRCFTSKRKKKT